MNHVNMVVVVVAPHQEELEMAFSGICLKPPATTDHQPPTTDLHPEAGRTANATTPPSLPPSNIQGLTQNHGNVYGLDILFSQRSSREEEWIPLTYIQVVVCTTSNQPSCRMYIHFAIKLLASSFGPRPSIFALSTIDG